MRFRGSLIGGTALSLFLLALVSIVLWQLVANSADAQWPLSSISARDWRVVQFTFVQAALSTLLSLSIGLLLAWALSHQPRFFGRSLLVALLSTALVLPTLVVVLGLVTVLGRKGWINDFSMMISGQDFGGYIYGLAGILIAHAYLNGSLATRSLLSRLDTIPQEKRKLVQSLGLSPLQRFRLIEWPAIKTTLPGLGATIFLLCFTSFAIVLTLGGSPKFNTLEVAIFEAVKLDFDLPRALDLALLQLLICALLVLLTGELKSNIAMIAPKNSMALWPDALSIRLLQWLLIVLLGAAFLLPLLAVLLDGLYADYARLFREAAFQKALISSLTLASLSALFLLGASLVMSAAIVTLSSHLRYGSQNGAGFIVRIISFSSMLYLALPSLVLGLGFFLIAQRLSGPLNLWAAIALLTANVLMALPFAMAILLPSMQKAAQRYDRLAISLNLKGRVRWRLIEWPILRHDIGYVAAVAFCLSLGDLGVIALFGSQDFATLPWYLYQKMGSYRTDDAAGVALIMLTLTLLVFLFLPKLFAPRQKNGMSDANN